MSSGHKTNIQRNNVSKIERKEKIQKSSIHPSYTHSPNHKISYTNPPPMSITLISKILTLFVTSDKGQVHQVDISSSLGELAPLSSSATSSSESVSMSSDAAREGEEATVSVLRRAPMCTSCAMMALSVTPPAEDEGVEVDGVVEAKEVAVFVCGLLG